MNYYNSYRRVPETCPALDKVIADFIDTQEIDISVDAEEFLIEQIKKVVSYPLREGLEEVLGELQDVDNKVEEAADIIDNLNAEIADLESQLADMRNKYE